MKRLLLCFAVLFLALAEESHAQWNGGGYGYGAYYNRGIYVDQERIPYFSLHPPVYLQLPGAASVWIQPVRLPGIVPTPELKTREPAVLVNPYVNEEPLPQTEPRSPNDAPALKPKKSATRVSRRTIRSARLCRCGSAIRSPGRVR